MLVVALTYALRSQSFHHRIPEHLRKIVTVCQATQPPASPRTKRSNQPPNYKYSSPPGSPGPSSSSSSSSSASWTAKRSQPSPRPRGDDDAADWISVDRRGSSNNNNDDDDDDDDDDNILFGDRRGQGSNQFRTPRKKFGELHGPSASGRGAGASGGKPDPWKVLIKKLDTTKSAKDKFGKAMAPIAASGNVPDELKCRHFQTCSGCTLMGNFTDAPIIRRAKTFFQSEGVRFPVHLSNHTQWRTHVKLAVQPLSRWGGLKFGLYRAGSHEVEPIPDCKVHHPKLNEAAEELRLCALDMGVKGYSEGKSSSAGPQEAQGELRYIQMSLERFTGKVQLVLVWNAFQYKDAEQTLPRLVKKLKSTRPDLWHSISVNFQTSASNAIFNYNPKAWKVLWGPPTIQEQIGRAKFYFRPQIFRQVSTEMEHYMWHALGFDFGGLSPSGF
jgi:hypothetical protein